ncbi:Modification methylase BanI [Methylobacterium crusticola]|uniref:DNA (cytosine-5-)-methyltransferase n=1 Tax=Methylobacterium crusticola TaxID=1697972 RepID=A0ABQ4R0V2_9HYPH|nr:DNA cytosine methyltransferase [Methylobacterium crusticola]GJD51059.1 Modification methylase BanI [Methylobacterium crusticola]
MKAGTAVRAAKLERIRKGGAPRVLELCSGCGGMSLGLKAAGFDLVAHIEMDVTAAASYALNFDPPSAERREAWAAARDMTQSDPESLCRDLGLDGPVAEQFDILAAGLPCQAFARIGRSKLRSIAGEEDAFKHDPRARLYQHFLQHVEAVLPVAILIENVPDILNFGGHNVPEEICSTLEGLGYFARYTLLNAAYYGVPQMRERLFLVAIDASLGQIPRFPTPTHAAKLPSGYQGTRTVALRHVPAEGGRFTQAPVANPGLPPAVTVRAALSDLPRITEHFSDPGAMRRRSTSDVLPYVTYYGLTDYAAKMRAWPGLPKCHAGTDGHVVRLTPRDFEIFQRMRVGGDFPHASAVANQIFAERLRLIDPQPAESSEAWQTIRKSCVPPYDPGKFPNKWWKMDPAMPSRTLTAHMGKDTYSHIHWDSRQKRTVSVREAARLQSFPDAFRFAGAMNAAFRQIGNAVPPVLAQAVGQQLKLDLSRARALKHEPSEAAAATKAIAA